MGALGTVGGVIIAIFLGFFLSPWIGVSLGLAVLTFQFVLSYGRSAASTSVINSPAKGAIADVVRNGVFLIPLVISIAGGWWLGVGGVIAAYILSMIGASYSWSRPN